jgi:hypothetical protein
MIISSFFNHLPDGQRGQKWIADKKLVQTLISSCQRVGLPVKILTNCFPSNNIFVRCYPPDNMLPNMARWLCIRSYLEIQKPEWFFCVDSTDVEVMRIPEIEKGYIYSGDEIKMTVGNEWMRKYQRTHVRIKDYDQVINANKDKRLLNCGVVGGYYEDVYPFIVELSGLHHLHSRHNDLKAAGSVDMATYNYLIYKKYIDKVVHGFPVNSDFKEFQTDTQAWFRHK